MSFELFLQSFSDGAPSGIPLEAIRAAFGSALSEPEEDFWIASYGDGLSSDLFLVPLTGQPSLIHTLSIHRPCADERLYEGLWRILEQPGTLLYFPGGPAPLTRDGSIARAMPPSMREALGAPTIATTAAEILHTIGTDHE